MFLGWAPYYKDGKQTNVQGLYAQANDGDLELSKFIMRKVGTGKLTTDMYGVANWEVTDGELAFKELPDDVTNLNAYSQKYISSITVSGSGKVSGALRSDAVTEIKSLIYDGTQFGLSATNDDGTLKTEVANPIWTDSRITATKLQNGCAFVCDDDTLALLKDVPVGTTIDNVMTATNLSGAMDELVVTRRADGKKDLVWVPSVGTDGVTLKLVKKGQFFLIIR